MEVFFEYCLEMNLLLGSIFLITGLITNAFPPKKINPLYGYRTTRSMKNQANWDIAQRISTQKMIQGSLALIAFGFLKSILSLNEIAEVWIGVLSSIAVVIYIFYSTETELKKKDTPCQ
jgi:uncharacterized membrane protein